jgi:hypothetical protein
MKKMGYIGIIAATGATALMAYSLMNKATKKKADMLVNDMITKTDNFIKGK